MPFETICAQPPIPKEDQMKVAVLTMDGEDHYFASLDGEHYIGTSRPAHAGDEELVADLMNGDDGFKPLLLHEHWLRHSAQAHGEVLELVEL
jgi:hypothetical protein